MQVVTENQRSVLPNPRPTPSAEEPEDHNHHRWTLAKRDLPGAEELLVSSSCAVCHCKVAREYTVEGNFLVVTPWMHSYATTHLATPEVK